MNYLQSPLHYIRRKHMDIDKLTAEDLRKIKALMDKAEEDTTPYAITDEDDGIQIVGDPNKTEIVKYQYELQFAYPKSDENRQRLSEMQNTVITKETDNYIVVKRSFKDVWVPPRIYTSVQTAFAEVYQFLNVITDDGGIRDLTEDEMIEALRMLDQDMIEAMCHAVATILRIPQQEEPCMIAITVMPVIMKMIEDFPEIINGMDFFTDGSSETELKVL